MPFTSSDGFYVTQWRDILVFVLRLYVYAMPFVEKSLDCRNVRQMYRLDK